MGAPIVWFLDEGIVLIEANPALLGQIQTKTAEIAANIARQSPLAAAKAYETKEELQALVDYAQSAFQGNAVLSGIKVVGSAAWSGAVTVGASATFGPTAGISAGIYAGRKQWGSDSMLFT